MEKDMPENNNPFEEFNTSKTPLRTPKTDPSMVLAQNYSELAFALLGMVNELGPMLVGDEVSKDEFIDKWNEHLAWIETLSGIHAQSIIEMI